MTSARAADAFARGNWREVCRELESLSADQLTPADLERRAIASYLTGGDGDAVTAWEQAYRQHASAGEHAAAAECAFWVAFCLMLQGQMAHARGWLSRTEDMLGELDCPAAGYVLIPTLLAALDSGDAAAARDLALRAGEIGERFSDRDLLALSMLGHGQALLALGEEAAALARLDDVMLSVCSGEVGPIVSGTVYCAVILECMHRFDLARASEWTAALDRWCAAQPDLVPYRGQCLVHQSQLQQAAGDWKAAVSTVAAARDRLSDPPHPALGLACYQEGELHRLRGEFGAAADAYARANHAGYPPMPGFALLEWVRGDVGAAAGSIRRALIDAVQPFQRPPLLHAAVEIFVAAQDVAAARETADELLSIAQGSSSQVLRAIAEQATGSVLLAAGEPSEALAHLRAASAVWLQLRLPYETARAGVLLGRACLALGDDSSARLELDGARETFASLGAVPDARALAELTDEAVDNGGRLSTRELEVLAQVANGKTNREIAAALSISRHTVGRHLENISAKLGVSGRAAVTAYAYEHDLL